MIVCMCVYIYRMTVQITYLMSSQVTRHESQLRTIHREGDQQPPLVGEDVQDAGVLNGLVHVFDAVLQGGTGEDIQLQLSAMAVFHLLIIRERGS